jgi:hypothetical protein
MSATGRPPKKEEHAPSLFGWVRSGMSKTRDDAVTNPHLGQVNVGVSQSARRTLRLPRGLLVWAVVLVSVGVIAAVIGPAIATFVESFEGSFESRDVSRSESFQEKMTDCLSGAGGDIDRIVECTSK